MKKIYGQIAKAEEQDDGTLKVWGYASSGEVDSDGEVILPSAIEAALADYMKFGAVREMHQPLAAGTAIEANVQEDGKTWFGAHIVDPIAVKKVQTEVYKGFSIGGKVLKRDPLNKSTITEIKLVEVSLVDRPANPEAVFTMYKSDTPDDKPSEEPTLEETTSEETKPEETPTEESQTQPEETGKSESVSFKKGMSQVSNFAYLLRDLSWLVEDTSWEASYEGDGSAIPQALVAWLAQGAAIFEAMAKEEVEEMIAQLNNAVASLPAVIQLNEKGGDLGKSDNIEKAGAKFSSASKSALAEMHKMAGDLCDKFAKLGYADEDDGGEDVDDADKSDTPEDLTKVNKTLADDLEKVTSENNDLKKRIAELEKQPEPSKVARNSVAVEKSADSDALSSTTEKQEEVPPEGTQARVEYEMKKVFKAGGTRLN